MGHQPWFGAGLAAALAVGCASGGAGLRQDVWLSVADDSSNSGASADSSNQSSNSSQSGGGGTAPASNPTSSDSFNSLNNSSGQGGSSYQGAQSSYNSQQSSENSLQNSSNQSTAQTLEATTQNTVGIFASTVIVATTVGLGYLIWIAMTRPSVAAPAAAHAYLRENEKQLRQDLALGAGPCVDDLAAIAELRPESVKRFGALLHQHRAEILELSSPADLTDARAAEVFQRIGGWARADRELALDYQRFQTRHAEGALAAQGG